MMAIVRISQTAGFDVNRFWIENSGHSTNETFESRTSTEETTAPPSRTDHYDEFVFNSGGFKYNYFGDWTVSGRATTGFERVSAHGSYQSVVIEAGGSMAASVTGLDFDVDFGTRSGFLDLNLETRFLSTINELFFGASTAYANLHYGATPKLAEIAFSGKDWMYGNIGDDALRGYGGNDVLRGGAGNDFIWGGAGNDLLQGDAGRDRLQGGDGNDTLLGGLGQDSVEGNGGADRFLFTSILGSTNAAPDTIIGFTQGLDKIDLARIDADVTVAGGNDVFNFIGSAAFSGDAGELRFHATASRTIIQGDVNGGGADFTIQLNTPLSLSALDFIL
jgi:Ca2+-binding RTX toxin-like protein